MDLTHRIDQPEIMDTTEVSVDAMRRTLRFLQSTNEYFGGIAVFLRFFQAWSVKWKKGETIRILDIGTGSAEIPLAIAAWARKNNFDIHITGIDMVDEVVQIAQEKTKGFQNITILNRDLFDLEERFDYVISSLLLHHIRPDKTIEALQAFDRLAARGVIVSDLLRTRASYWAVTALSWLIGNDIVRHDGPLSVRRAFLPIELNQFAHDAKLNYMHSKTEPWFRVSLAGEKP